MSKLRPSLRAVTGLAVALPALSLAMPAFAQADLPPLPVAPQIGPVAVETVAPTLPDAPPIPAAPTALPRPNFGTQTSVSPDGVETITRTRRITRSTPLPNPNHRRPTAQHGYPQAYPHGHAAPVAAAPVVFNEEQWLDQCERRTRDLNDNDRSTILGGLIGAAAGGLIGNRVAGRRNRLAGSLIGGGVGGLAGAALGSSIDRKNRNREALEQCEAALNQYLSQPTHATAGHGFAGYAPAYTGNYAYSAGCGCQQQQVVWIPVRSETRQRVIVREVVREERIPGRRIVPPSPKLIKEAPRPFPAPRPVKLIKN